MTDIKVAEKVKTHKNFINNILLSDRFIMLFHQIEIVIYPLIMPFH